MISAPHFQIFIVPFVEDIRKMTVTKMIVDMGDEVTSQSEIRNEDVWFTE